MACIELSMFVVFQVIIVVIEKLIKYDLRIIVILLSVFTLNMGSCRFPFSDEFRIWKTSTSGASKCHPPLPLQEIFKCSIY